MSVQVVLDRVEGAFAILSVLDGDEPPVEIPARWLPEGTQDGDTLSLVLEVAAADGDARRAALEARLARLTGR